MSTKLKILELQESANNLTRSFSDVWFTTLDSESLKTKKISYLDLLTFLSSKIKSDDISITATGGLSLTNNSDKPISNIVNDGEYKINNNKTVIMSKNAYDKANSAYVTANSAYVKANSAYDYANTVYANTIHFLDIAEQANTNANDAYVNAVNAIQIAAFSNDEIINHMGSVTQHPVVTITANGFMSYIDKNNLDTTINNGSGKIIINTGDGLSGGSSVSSNVFTITANLASTTANGVVKLDDTLTSKSTTRAATANVANTLNNILSKKATQSNNIITINTANNLYLSGGQSKTSNSFHLFLKNADVSTPGIVQLNDTFNAQLANLAATANVVNVLNSLLMPNTNTPITTISSEVSYYWVINDHVIQWGTSSIPIGKANVEIALPYKVNSYSCIIATPQYSNPDLNSPLRCVGAGGISANNLNNFYNTITDGKFFIYKNNSNETANVWVDGKISDTKKNYNDINSEVRVSWFFIGLI